MKEVVKEGKGPKDIRLFVPEPAPAFRGDAARGEGGDRRVFRGAVLPFPEFTAGSFGRLLRVLVMLLGIFCGVRPAWALGGRSGPDAAPMPNPGRIGNLLPVAEITPWGGQLAGIYFETTPALSINGDLKGPGRGYNWKGPPPESPDWRGVKWDTASFLAYQFVAIGVIYMTPESFSGWSKEDKEQYSLDRWVKNVRNPVWDGDDWWVNYILHPYWGSTYYTRARERGLRRPHSFWYSVLLSSLFEFGSEALFEPVSLQDLVVTPVAGSLVGEYVVSPVRRWARSKDRLRWSDKALLFLTDPLGVVNAGVSRVLGMDAEVSYRPTKSRASSGPPGNGDGSKVRLLARNRIEPAWGLYLKVRW